MLVTLPGGGANFGGSISTIKDHGHSHAQILE